MIYVLIGLLGMTLHALGMVLQKVATDRTNWNNRKSKQFLIGILIWCSGIFFSVILSAIPTAISSKFLPPYIISALSSWSIIVGLILSYFLLREKIHLSDFVYSIIISICIVIMGYCSNNDKGQITNSFNLTLLIFCPAIIILPVFFKKISDSIKAVCVSTYSGMMSGITLVLMNVVIKASNFSVSQIINSPYFLIYYVAGLASLIFLQLGFRYGKATLVIPLQTSFSIIYPVICAFFIYESKIPIICLFQVLIIIVCCWAILRKRT